MLRVLVRSRIGNIVLGVIGVAYAIASLALLVLLVIDVWESATFSDLLVQTALITAAACGIWFALNARENLGGSSSPHSHSLGGTSNAASAHR
jgi:ABC-type uncharacterized transport system permease subunit